MNIIGRITRDAAVKQLQNETTVVNFSIAINDSYKNKQGERIQRTEYVDCAWFRSVGVAKILTKGTLVNITGRISARAWVNKDGEAKAGLQFTASNIEVYGGGRAGGSHTSNGAGTVSWVVSTTPVAADHNATADDLPF